MKVTITTICAATVLGIVMLAPASAPARAEIPTVNGVVPLPAWPLVPLMLVLNAKEDKSFQAAAAKSAGKKKKK